MAVIKPRVIDPLMVAYYGSLIRLEKAYKAADAAEIFLHVQHLQLLLKMAEAAANNVARRSEKLRQEERKEYRVYFQKMTIVETQAHIAAQGGHSDLAEDYLAEKQWKSEQLRRAQERENPPTRLNAPSMTNPDSERREHGG